MDRNTLLNRPSAKSSGFSKYNAVLNEMDKLSWLTLSKNLPFSKGLAFVTRLHGDSVVYQIYVSKYANEEERIPLWIHEAGHVLLSHLGLNKKQHDTVVSKIMSAWSAISEKVDLTKAVIKSGLTLNEVARKNYAKKISHALLSIAMDFEVNSKMFSEEEWLNMKDLTEEVYIRGIASEGSDEEVEKIISTLEKGEKVTRPWWPADYGFPLKLNYNQYVDLIIENFEQFIR